MRHVQRETMVFWHGKASEEELPSPSHGLLPLLLFFVRSGALSSGVGVLAGIPVWCMFGVPPVLLMSLRKSCGLFSTKALATSTRIAILTMGTASSTNRSLTLKRSSFRSFRMAEEVSLWHERIHLKRKSKNNCSMLILLLF